MGSFPRILNLLIPKFWGLAKKSVNRKPFLAERFFSPTKIFSTVTRVQTCRRRRDLKAYNFLPCFFYCDDWDD